jgi:tight adherence protein B
MRAAQAAVGQVAGVQVVAAWCSVLCAVAAVLLLRRQEETLRRARLLLADGTAPTGWRRCPARLREVVARGRSRLEERIRVRLRLGRELWCVPGGVLLALVAHSPLPAVAGVLATPCVGRALRRRQHRLAAERWRDAVVDLCAAVAGDLRAGHPPDAALAEAVERLRTPPGRVPAGWLTPLLAAARFGGDVPQALCVAARYPGAAGLAAVAACWEVAVDGGAGLADGLDQVAAALRAERDQREELRAQLAGARSTAAMLALLPAFGVLLGCLMGADPLRVLLRTPVGLGCLAVGGLLEWAGLAWTSRITRAAEGA